MINSGETIKEINAVHKVIVEKMKFELEKRDNEMREMKRDILNMKEFIETITNQDNKKTKTTEGLYKYKNIKRQGEKLIEILFRQINLHNQLF